MIEQVRVTHAPTSVVRDRLTARLPVFGQRVNRVGARLDGPVTHIRRGHEVGGVIGIRERARLVRYRPRHYFVPAVGVTTTGASVIRTGTGMPAASSAFRAAG